MFSFGNRSVKQIVRAAKGRQHYIALFNMWKLYPDFVNSTRRYLTSYGEYPCQIAVRTPTGVVRPTLFVRDDILTVNEIFCRRDYPCDERLRIVVDVGSNIGISALYFLSRNSTSHCYLFEPNHANVEKLKSNLQGLEDRYSLSTDAVSDMEGTVSFGIEPTGRYGGIGLPMEETIQVKCRNVNDVLEEVLSRHNVIDVLKLDIEGAEVRTVNAIDPGFYSRIDRIFLEANVKGELIPSVYLQQQYGSVVQLQRRSELR